MTQALIRIMSVLSTLNRLTKRRVELLSGATDVDCAKLCRLAGITYYLDKEKQ